MRYILNNTYAYFFYNSILYTLLGYFVLRTDELWLQGIFALLFVFFILQTRLIKISFLPFPKLSYKQILWLAIIIRFSLLFSLPKLSDDYFRFIWDGNIMFQGENPYKFTPESVVPVDIENWNYLHDEVYNGQSMAFPQGMNSKEHYSVYPPVNQVFFVVASALSRNSVWLNVVFLRLFIIIFEVGVIIFLGKLLVWFKKDKSLVGLYALNPLVIIELTGNLHFEGVTLFFVLAAIWYLLRKKYLFAGFIFALGIGTKLIPLLFLPFFLFKIPLKKLFIFYAVVVATVAAMFLPFTNISLIDTFGRSIQLYFSSFEFNASLYYIFREIGIWFTGYNQIAMIGFISQAVIIGSVIILLITGRKEKRMKSVFNQLLWILLIYYSLASVVHPWYVIYLIALSILTNYRFPIVWSFVVILSYWAYRTTGVVEENYWLIGVEYLVLFGVVFIELNIPIRKKIFHLFAQG